MNKIISVFIIASLLFQNSAYAGTNFLAPPSEIQSLENTFQTKKTPVDRYGELIQRFIKNYPKFIEVPEEKFGEFLRKSEILFKEYFSYTRFPYNAHAAMQFSENKKAQIRELQRLKIEALGHLEEEKRIAQRRLFGD